MASRTATSALPWHQYSGAAADEALDVDRRAGVVATSALLERGAENARPGTGSRSVLALRHRGTRKRRYLSRILRVASSGLAPPAGRREEELITDDAGVLCAVWNAGDEHADASPASRAPSASQGRRRLSSEKTRPALASSGEHAGPACGGRPKWNPSSSDVHRIEKSSSGSMSMNDDAVELLKDSTSVAAASTSSRRSKDGADNDRGLHLLGHPPREKLSQRDGEVSMESERASSRGQGE